MDFRYHATKSLDYSIRVALISIIAVPLWFCAWWAVCGVAEPPEPGSSADMVCGGVAIPGLVFLSPGYFAVKALRFLHIPSIAFGTLDWVVAFVCVPLFWGTLLYCIVQLFRYVRISRHASNQTMQPTASPRTASVFDD
jgi:hypothetical protein